MKDEQTKRVMAEMREVAKAVIARYTPDRMCESPRCSPAKKPLFGGKEPHKATMATRVEGSSELKAQLAKHSKEKHPDGKGCWLDRVCSEQGLLLCFCCVAQVSYKLLEVGLLPGKHYRMASVPVVSEKHAMSNTTRECGRTSSETIELVNEARKMAMGGAEIRSMAIDKEQITEIMKREGPEGVRRFLTEQIAKTIGDDIMAAMTEEQPLGDGEVGAPISDSELLDIRRSLINDVDTLPTDISSMLGRQDN